MNNLTEDSWKEALLQIKVADNLHDAARQERRKVLIAFLKEHTVQNPCFTETVVAVPSPAGSNRYVVKMMHIISSRLGEIDRPRVYFDTKKSALFTPFGSYRQLPIASERADELLDGSVITEIIQEKIKADMIVPELRIPKGVIAFRFQAKWAAGGYDDPPTTQKLVFEADSLEDAFEKLRRMLMTWQKENFFGNFWVGLPEAERWERLEVEPEYTNLHFINQIEIGKFRLKATKERPQG